MEHVDLRFFIVLFPQSGKQLWRCQRSFVQYEQNIEQQPDIQHADDNEYPLEFHTQRRLKRQLKSQFFLDLRELRQEYFLEYKVFVGILHEQSQFNLRQLQQIIKQYGSNECRRRIQSHVKFAQPCDIRRSAKSKYFLTTRFP